MPVYDIALSAKQVRSIMPELLIAHRFYILENLGTFTPPLQ
jgi:hypothetical protein